jgi:hypothetical protein
MTDASPNRALDVGRAFLANQEGSMAPLSFSV